MSLTMMCGLFCFAFTFDSQGIHWIWNDQKPAVVSLAVATLVFSVLWIRAARQLKEGKK